MICGEITADSRIQAPGQACKISELIHVVDTVTSTEGTIRRWARANIERNAAFHAIIVSPDNVVESYVQKLRACGFLRVEQFHSNKEAKQIQGLIQ